MYTAASTVRTPNYDSRIVTSFSASWTTLCVKETSHLTPDGYFVKLPI